VGDAVTAVEPTALVGVKVGVGDGAATGIVAGPWGDGVPKAVELIVGVAVVGVAVAGLTVGTVVDRGTGGLGAGVVAGERM